MRMASYWHRKHFSNLFLISRTNPTIYKDYIYNKFTFTLHPTLLVNFLDPSIINIIYLFFLCCWCSIFNHSLWIPLVFLANARNIRCIYKFRIWNPLDIIIRAKQQLYMWSFMRHDKAREVREVRKWQRGMCLVRGNNIIGLSCSKP